MWRFESGPEAAMSPLLTHGLQCAKAFGIGYVCSSSINFGSMSLFKYVVLLPSLSLVLRDYYGWKKQGGFHSRMQVNYQHRTKA